MDYEIDFLIVGKKSFDNRAVKNILLSQDFDEGDDTLIPEVDGTVFEANRIHFKVTSTPGLMDCISGITGLQMKNKIEYSLKFKQFKEGFDSVLIVCSYPVRWTPEEARNMSLIRDLVGQKRLEKNAIIVFTDTEALRRDRSMSFDEACRHYISREMLTQSPDSFGYFLRLVQERCIFLTKDDNDALNMQQIRKLVGMVSKFSKFTLYETSLLPSYMQNRYLLFQIIYWILVGVYEWFFPPYKVNNENKIREYQDYLKLNIEERARLVGQIDNMELEKSISESWN